MARKQTADGRQTAAELALGLGRTSRQGSGEAVPGRGPSTPYNAAASRANCLAAHQILEASIGRDWSKKRWPRSEWLAHSCKSKIQGQQRSERYRKRGLRHREDQLCWHDPAKSLCLGSALALILIGSLQRETKRMSWTCLHHWNLQQ